METFCVEEIAGDGHCFYRCVVRSLLHNIVLPPGARIIGIDEDEGRVEERDAVRHLREFVADRVIRDKDVKEWIRTLIHLHRGTDGGINLTADNPLLARARCLSDVAGNIVHRNVWASQIEIQIVKRQLEHNGIALVLVERSQISAANALIAATDKISLPLALLVVRVETCHYNLITLAGAKLLPTAWLMYKAACLAMLEDDDHQLF